MKSLISVVFPEPCGPTSNTFWPDALAKSIRIRVRIYKEKAISESVSDYEPQKVLRLTRQTNICNFLALKQQHKRFLDII